MIAAIATPMPTTPHVAIRRTVTRSTRERRRPRAGSMLLGGSAAEPARAAGASAFGVPAAGASAFGVPAAGASAFGVWAAGVPASALGGRLALIHDKTHRSACPANTGDAVDVMIGL